MNELGHPVLQAVYGLGGSGYVCMVANLKKIDARDFNILLDEMSVGTQVRWNYFEERTG